MQHNYFTHSSYERRENDHYPTIDRRCMKALLNTWDFPLPAIDVCTKVGEPTPLKPAVNGTFKETLGEYRSIITNPPYKKGVVDGVVERIIDTVKKGHIEFATILVRVQWDCASTRDKFFNNKHFAGATRLQFRPYWSSERKHSPIHSYQWLVWKDKVEGFPVLKYDKGE